MDSRAYQSALQLNKHCDAMLSLEEHRLDKQKRDVYNRVFREKELLLDEYIHINIRTPSPSVSERYRLESAKGPEKRSSAALSSERSRRVTSAKVELNSRQKSSPSVVSEQSPLLKVTGDDGDLRKNGSVASLNVRYDPKRPHTVTSGRPMSSTGPRRHPSTPRSPSADKADTTGTTATMDISQSSETVTSKRETRDPSRSAVSAVPYRSSRVPSEATPPTAQKVASNPRPALKITVERADSSSRCYSTPGYVPKTHSTSSSPARPSFQVRRLSVASPENIKLADDKRDRDLTASGSRRRSVVEVDGVFTTETVHGIGKHDADVQPGASQDSSQSLHWTAQMHTNVSNEDSLAFYRRALLGASLIQGEVNSKPGIRENDKEQVNSARKSSGITKSRCQNGNHTINKEPSRPQNAFNNEEEPSQCEQEEKAGDSCVNEQDQEEETVNRKAVRRMTLDPKLVLPLTAKRYQVQKSATIIPVITVKGHRATMYPNASAKVGRVVTLERKAIGWLERSAAIFNSLEKIRCKPRSVPVPVATPSKTLPWTPQLNMTSSFGMMSFAGKTAYSDDDTKANSVFSAPSSARPVSQPAMVSSSDDDDSDDYDVVLVPQTIDPDPEAAEDAKPSTPETHQRQKVEQKIRGIVIGNQRQGQAKKVVPSTYQRPERMTRGVPFVNVRQHQAAKALPVRRSQH